MKRSIFDSIFVKPKHVWEEANFMKSQTKFNRFSHLLYNWTTLYLQLHIGRLNCVLRSYPFQFVYPLTNVFWNNPQSCSTNQKINIEKNKKYRKNENWIPFSDALFCGQGIDPCEMFWTLVYSFPRLACSSHAKPSVGPLVARASTP